MKAKRLLVLCGIFCAFMLVLLALIIALPLLFRGPFQGSGNYFSAAALALGIVAFLVWVSRFIAMDYPLPPDEDPFLGKSRCIRSIEINRNRNETFDLCLQYISTLPSKVVLAEEWDLGFIQIITPDSFLQIFNCSIQFIIRFELEPITADRTVIHYSSRYAPLGARGIESDREGMNRQNIKTIGEFFEPFRVSYKK